MISLIVLAILSVPTLGIGLIAWSIATNPNSPYRNGKLHEPRIMESKGKIIEFGTTTLFVENDLRIFSDIYELRNNEVATIKTFQNYNCYDAIANNDFLYTVDKEFVRIYDTDFTLINSFENKSNIRRLTYADDNFLYFPVVVDDGSPNHGNWSGDIKKISIHNPNVEEIVSSYPADAFSIQINGIEFHLDEYLFAFESDKTNPYIEVDKIDKNSLLFRYNNLSTIINVNQNEFLLSYPIYKESIIFFSTYERNYNDECLLYKHGFAAETICLCYIGKTYLYKYNVLTEEIEKHEFIDGSYIFHYCEDTIAYFRNEEIYINENMVKRIDGLVIEEATERYGYYSIYDAKSVNIFVYFKDDIYYAEIDRTKSND